jgi:hypothetical protein
MPIMQRWWPSDVEIEAAGTALVAYEMTEAGGNEESGGWLVRSRRELVAMMVERWKQRREA